MRLWVGVENFAKIESAKICIDNYTVLVGENNSGKTFLMQIAQGVGEKLGDIVGEEIRDIIRSDDINEQGKYVVSEKNISEIVDYYNNKLETQKEKIVQEIFGKIVPIEKLYIDIFLDAGEGYEIYDCNQTEEWKERLNSFLSESEYEGVRTFLENGANELERTILLKTNYKTGSNRLLLASVSADKERNVSRLFGRIFSKVNLFLPASRTGLMLLYRDFFANKTDEAITFNSARRIEQVENSYSGLTRPVYNFLRFLQTYREDDNSKRRFEKELQFFEKKLISGHIKAAERGSFSYQPNDETSDVPMYLASSMINEIAPLALAITGTRSVQRLIIDEVEASLHPEKQSELVRFLNRLSNRGIQLIISTHSDTIASKINNLYLLSQYAKDHDMNETKAILDKFGMEKADLIDPDKLFIYEVVNQTNGKSVVREVKGSEKNGFQFDQFTKSAMQIYDEAMRIGELLYDEGQTSI